MRCPLTGKPCLCPKEITITELKGGQYTSLHLCKECGITYMQNAEAELLAEKTEMTTTPDGVATKIMPKEKACPHCGATLSEIARKKRVGCAQCYEFHKELDPLVMQSQGAMPGEQIEHVGKSPPDHRLREQLERLENKMSEAVKLENYEQAAVIRDAIAELKKRIA